MKRKTSRAKINEWWRGNGLDIMLHKVPTSLVDQWMQELGLIAPNFKVYRYHGDKKEVDCTSCNCRFIYIPIDPRARALSYDRLKLFRDIDCSFHHGAFEQRCYCQGSLEAQLEQQKLDLSNRS